MSNWLSALGDIGLNGAAQLGLVQKGPRRSWGPCPSCGALRASEKNRQDKRLTLVSKDGRWWWCRRCETSGDAADLASWAATGVRVRSLDRHGRGQLKRWVADRLPLLQAAAVDVEVPAPRPRTISYPPQDEVEALYESALDVREAEFSKAAEWVERRAGVPLDVVAQTNMCRVLEQADARPEWWPYGQKWNVLFGLYDARGDLRSVLGRTHDEHLGKSKGKERPPVGFDRGSLWCANREAQDWLRGKAQPELVWLFEGPTTALRLASQFALIGKPSPVLGGFSGSWTSLRDMPWHKGCRVASGMDDDDEGQRYADRCRSNIPARVKVTRIHWNAFYDAVGGHLGQAT